MKKHSRKLKQPYFTVENLNFSYKPDQSDQFDWLEPTLRSDQTEVEDICLSEINFSLERGECLLLTGPSGCGKTTLLRTINGIIPEFYSGQLDGEINLNQKSVLTLKPEQRGCKIGSIFQNPRSQFFNIIVQDELSFGCENLNISYQEIQTRLAPLIEQFQFESYLERRLFDLSGGEKQRVACLSIAAMQPELILYDEPSSNLDKQGMEALRDLMLNFKELGITQIVAEHRLAYLEDVSDKVMLMSQGKIIKRFTNQDFQALNFTELDKLGIRKTKKAYVNLIKPNMNLVKSKPVEIKQPNLLYLKNKPLNFPEKVLKQNALAIKSLYLKYPRSKFPVLDFENYNFVDQNIHVLTGSNGVGKTSLIHALAGLEKRAKGEVVWQREKIRLNKLNKLCGVVFQDINHQLFSDSCFDEMALSLENQKFTRQEIEELIKNMADRLDLADHLFEHPMNLSGGQKQRLAIASTILLNRPILILDEPTSGLDFKNMQSIANLIKEIAKEKLILIVTHDQELIFELEPIIHECKN